MDNLTDITIPSHFVKMAMDEFNSHITTNNITGLIQTYWNIVDNQLGGLYIF